MEKKDKKSEILKEMDRLEKELMCALDETEKEEYLNIRLDMEKRSAFNEMINDFVYKRLGE